MPKVKTNKKHRIHNEIQKQGKKNKQIILILESKLKSVSLRIMTDVTDFNFDSI